MSFEALHLAIEQEARNMRHVAVDEEDDLPCDPAHDDGLAEAE